MKNTDNGYYVNRHSCFLLQYHLVLVTKFRHRVLTGDVEDFLKKYTLDYFEKRDCNIIELNCNEDHIHILFEAPPQLNLAAFVNAYKSASSRRIRTLFAEVLAPYYWKSYFWSLSYFIGSVSERTAKAVSHYIAHQKD